MKLSLLILGVSMATTITTIVATKKADSQVLDIKPWHGDYPEMNGNYPLSFIAFKKGGLIPTPYVFVRSWPTYYYVALPSVPVSDGAGYAERTTIGDLRIAAKMIERSQMKNRYQAKEVIRDDTRERKNISQSLFDARSDQLPDIYRLAGRFVTLYQDINRLDKLENSQPVKKILQKDANDLFMRFVMANLLDSSHGEKLDAFSTIYRELGQLSGVADYTFRKIQSYQACSQETNSLTFLAR